MISTLIALVLSLLIQVQQPNVPVDIKVQALALANTALQLAAQEASSTPTVTDLQAQAATSSAPTIVINVPAPVPDQIVAPVTVSAAVVPVLPALIVPVCNISAHVMLHAMNKNTMVGNYTATISWEMDSKASGVLSGYGALPAYKSGLPQYQSAAGNSDSVSIIFTGPQTYTLTETMTDPAYQQITTCDVAVDPSMSNY